MNDEERSKCGRKHELTVNEPLANGSANGLLTMFMVTKVSISTLFHVVH